MKRSKTWLFVLLTVIGAGGFVVAVLHFSGNAPWNRVRSGGSNDATLFTQEGAVSVKAGNSGLVVYGIPFGAPPKVEIKQAEVRNLQWKKDDGMVPGKKDNGMGGSGGGKSTPETLPVTCELIQQSELGFGWAVKIPDGMGTATEVTFTWKAKGPRPKLGKSEIELQVQQGSFQSIAGEQGMVNFPFPYALPPNVELSGTPSNTTLVVDCKVTGFKWKNAGKKESESGKVQWTAKGIKATALPE